MPFRQAKVKLQEMREQGMSEFEIDKASLKIIARETSLNILFFGIGATLIFFVHWIPFLWIGIVIYGVLALVNWLRGVVGLLGDIAAIFQKVQHAHLHRIIASLLIMLEAGVYSLATYFFLCRCDSDPRA